MRHSPVILPIVLLLAVATGVLVYRVYSSDSSAWNQVQLSLTRLSSGIEFEPVITLRSKLADTDAAIQTFDSELHILPRNRGEKLASAKRGVQYLGISIDDARRIQNWDDMQEFLEVSKFARRDCDGDHLAFSSGQIKQAFAIAGSYLIKNAAGEESDRDGKGWQGSYPALDLAKETAACRERNTQSLKLSSESKRAGDAMHAAAWKYHIDVSDLAGCDMIPYSDDQIVRIRGFHYAKTFHLHLDANDEAHLDSVFCGGGPPSAEMISIRINGVKFDPDWTLTSTGGIHYSVRLVP
jgi:hypothetical protein